MTCTKCSCKLGKKIKAIDLDLCDRCYSIKDLCCVEGCKKKIFLNGHCSTHISLVREVKKPYIGNTISEETLNRRRDLQIERDHVIKDFDRRHEEVNQMKINITYDPLSRRVEKSLLLQREREIDNDKEMFLAREYRNLERLKDNIINLSSTNAPKSKFKKYMEEEQDEYKRKKRAKQAAKEQRSDRRKPSEKKKPSKKFTTSTDYVSDDEYSDEDDDFRIDPEDEKFNKLVSDAFDILEIQKTRDENEIKKAYRICALKYHPDKNPGNDTTAIFQEIGYAYDFIIANIDQI